MIKLSKKVEYALISLVDLATRDRDDLVTTRDLSNQYQIPHEILGKVLQQLTKQGILSSVQGVKGGYTLAVEVNEINISKIIETVDGPISLIKCTHDEPCDCDQIHHCNIKTPMEIIQDELVNYFSRISLQDIKDRYISSISNRFTEYEPHRVANHD